MILAKEAVAGRLTGRRGKREAALELEIDADS